MFRHVAPILLFLPLALSAQLMSPPIEAGESTIRMLGAYAVIEDTGTSNQNWDFSALVPEQSLGLSFGDAPSSSLGKSFPNATFVVDDGEEQTFYSFDENATYHGGTDGTLVVVYSDPAIALPYPFAIGETWEDTYAAEYGAAGIMIYRTGSIATECLSSGSLTLPGGEVYEDVYHIHSTEVFLDSTFAGTLEFTIELDGLVSSDYGFALMGAVQVSTYDVPVGGTPVSNSYDYSIWMDSYVLGIEDITSLPTWGMMPNPASDAVTFFRSTGMASETIELVSMDGKVVMQSQFTFGQSSLNVDVSGLAEGVYLVRSSRTDQSQRLVIAH